ncbi:hypothetical protein GCM10018953_49540 [Streptosporangium nondiastaticum]
MLGSDVGGGLLAQADVAAEACQVLVAGLGLQLRRGPPRLREMLQRTVAQLVQGPAFAVRVERG